ncbi:MULTISPECIES: RNA polymerase factor sigma-54 [unclassified Halanaerobium]|uniref:RNA polymerase factor sigma-54 n=1 Tax=unclassified Halanaerobium TaxID=2641197 RepID=UPI000E1B46D2|nr:MULTISPECIES: RNA polymerase factor sigma-54 [unclassified Halanaerobium]RCW45688.1 RNA polymerase RpoN-/SigL-like sigma 54 subunit [Halanaerobium sp. MA284_MarDTE_T2]RCW88060.1 RNA polymerase RpoN-/SigL-like sigma 54 subunit [Halanaerobium sp. DL-01]
MELDFNLQMEQQQKLVMTPSLQMAIELLQYSGQELNEYVEEELQENPMLDREEVNIDDHFEARIRNQYQNFSGNNFSGEDEERDYSFENMVQYRPDLYEHLENQLFEVISPSEISIGRYIIGNLNESGFLEEDLDSISKKLNESREKVGKVLSAVQNLDPSGIGARDLQESLLIQLNNSMFDTDLAEKIIRDYFEELTEQRYEDIISSLEESSEDIWAALNLISTLDPAPGKQLTQEKEPEYIIPDIIVKEIKDDYVIILNEKASPTLRINPMYFQMMKEKNDSETAEFLEKKYKSALWLIKSIEQRRMTVYRLSRAIVERQKEFFDKGIEFLKTMTMDEIAEIIDMHESTVSRAASGKYMQTPRGLFSLKFFFSSGINGISSHSIKAIIRKYIEAEDPESPLSDSKLSDLISHNENLDLNRRTLAKYRNEMGIASSRKRKKKYKHP